MQNCGSSGKLNYNSIIGYITTADVQLGLSDVLCFVYN